MGLAARACDYIDDYFRMNGPKAADVVEQIGAISEDVLEVIRQIARGRSAMKNGDSVSIGEKAAHDRRSEETGSS